MVNPTLGVCVWRKSTRACGVWRKSTCGVAKVDVCAWRKSESTCGVAKVDACVVRVAAGPVVGHSRARSRTRCPTSRLRRLPGLA
eukprot:2321620-Rhodomonas_salina.1